MNTEEVEQTISCTKCLEAFPLHNPYKPGDPCPSCTDREKSDFKMISSQRARYGYEIGILAFGHPTHENSPWSESILCSSEEIHSPHKYEGEAEGGIVVLTCPGKSLDTGEATDSYFLLTGENIKLVGVSRNPKHLEGAMLVAHEGGQHIFQLSVHDPEQGLLGATLLNMVPTHDFTPILVESEDSYTDEATIFP